MGEKWKDKRVEIKCDNWAVVQVLNHGKAKDNILGVCARNIWMLTSIYNVDLVVNHIPGKQNHIADLLSRWRYEEGDELKLNELLPNHTWVPVHIDLTKLNTNI